MGFSSGLPGATEAVRAIGAGTGGSSRLSFNLCFDVTFGTSYGHQKWALTEGAQPASRGGEQLSQEPHPIRNQSKWEQLLPWGQTAHPGVPSSQRWVRSQLMASFPAQLRAGSVPCARHLRGAQAGGRTEAFLAALRTPSVSLLSVMLPSRSIHNIFKYHFLFAGHF